MRWTNKYIKCLTWRWGQCRTEKSLDIQDRLTIVDWKSSETSSNHEESLQDRNPCTADLNPWLGRNLIYEIDEATDTSLLRLGVLLRRQISYKDNNSSENLKSKLSQFTVNENWKLASFYKYKNDNICCNNSCATVLFLIKTQGWSTILSNLEFWPITNIHSYTKLILFLLINRYLSMSETVTFAWSSYFLIRSHKAYSQTKNIFN
jgi:hypothetical protein